MTWFFRKEIRIIIIITPKIRCCIKQKNILFLKKIILIILISFLKKRTNLFFNDYLISEIGGYFSSRLKACRRGSSSQGMVTDGIPMAYEAISYCW